MFSSLTVPSAVNKKAGRTYVSWKLLPAEPAWIGFLNPAFLQACPSMLAAAKTKLNETINTSPFLCLQKHSPKCHRKQLQLMEWNTLTMIICGLKRFVQLLITTPKELWNVSQDPWNVPDTLKVFKIEILICKFTLIMTLIIKALGERPSPSESKTNHIDLFPRADYVLQAEGKINWRLQTAVTACSCSWDPEKFHCWLWGKALNTLT